MKCNHLLQGRYSGAGFDVRDDLARNAELLAECSATRSVAGDFQLVSGEARERYVVDGGNAGGDMAFRVLLGCHLTRPSPGDGLGGADLGS